MSLNTDDMAKNCATNTYNIKVRYKTNRDNFKSASNQYWHKVCVCLVDIVYFLRVIAPYSVNFMSHTEVNRTICGFIYFIINNINNIENDFGSLAALA